MTAKRSHSLIELRVRQTRQEGVSPQCRLPNESWPVRGYDFRDDLMVPRREVLLCEIDSLFPPNAGSSEPPIENPEPGAPRVLGSGIELDADLRDRVPLHVAHD